MKFLVDTCVVFWGHWYPCFGFLGDVSSGFQWQNGFCLSHLFYRGKCNVHSSRSTSGATSADLLIAASHFPTCISRGGSWLRFERAITHTEDERTSIVPATRLYPSNLYVLDYTPLMKVILKLTNSFCLTF